MALTNYRADFEKLDNNNNNKNVNRVIKLYF